MSETATSADPPPLAPESSHASAPDSATRLLEDRYGHVRGRRMDRRIAWIGGGALVILGIAVLLFGNWQRSSVLEYRVVNYSVLDERTVRLSVQLTSPAQQPLACVFEALSDSYASVGWKLVEFPAQVERTRNVELDIVTTTPATTGTVRECWLTESS